MASIGFATFDGIEMVNSRSQSALVSALFERWCQSSEECTDQIW